MSGGSIALQSLFAQDGIIKCAGAHNAAAARLIEAAGFDAVWSSSFELSASHCVPDHSILSMSQYLEAARFLVDATRIPVIADCDTGFGDAMNFAYAAKQFESAGVAAICIEDQVFPKTNSLMPEGQRLVSIPEFQRKLSAAKSDQHSREFMIFARVEALITGAGQAEAQLRARAYADAGADAILIHWNRASFDPVEEFLKSWVLQVPLIVVPTTYCKVTCEQLKRAGAKMVIYANHGIRASLAAMEAVFSRILQEGSSANVEHSIWPVARIFEELQDLGHVTTPKPNAEGIQYVRKSGNSAHG